MLTRLHLQEEENDDPFAMATESDTSKGAHETGVSLEALLSDDAALTLSSCSRADSRHLRRLVELPTLRRMQYASTSCSALKSSLTRRCVHRMASTPRRRRMAPSNSRLLAERTALLNHRK